MTFKRSELSDEQRRALEHLQGKPLYVVDANTQAQLLYHDSHR